MNIKIENNKRFLITGAAGFIGYHLSKKLLSNGCMVLGLDNINDYYNIKLKISRLEHLKEYKNFRFDKVDISDRDTTEKIFQSYNPEKVINLAAQAGVRYSLENPQAYIDANVTGFLNILECCKNNDVENLVYASSSSVYGSNSKIPFSENDRIDKPISIYAATKAANELMAHTYSHLYGLNTTGLRFFTVYGPWGRPDMALFIFVDKIKNGQPIQVFNNGKMKRDFTYIDDIIDGIILAVNENKFCEIFNLGNNKSEKLLDMISIIEEQLGEKAKIEFKGMQPGDVKKTYANINHSKNLLGYNPSITIKEGIPRFIDWYKSYYKK